MGKAAIAKKPAPRKRRVSKQKQASIAATIESIKKLHPPNPKAAKLFKLLISWLEDDSGYDEEAWPELKKGLDRERARVGARRLFDA